MTLSETEYVERATRELSALITALDNIAEGYEAELGSDILTLEFPDGEKYVINSHTAARQIWMAAERQAWHFDFVPDRGAWVAAKSGDELWAALERVLSKKLGSAVKLG